MKKKLFILHPSGYATVNCFSGSLLIHQHVQDQHAHLGALASRCFPLGALAERTSGVLFTAALQLAPCSELLQELGIAPAI